MSVIENLEPKLLWKQFDEIRKIPRCSKKEEKIRKYLLDFAEKQGLESKTDTAGNVVIIKPASSGKEDKPTTVLQGHMDMVCEKNSDVDFDFDKDPIQLEKKEDILKAKGTTLGADDGIGMAIALAILEDKDLKLGAIEALFTVDEETGLTGAFALEKHMLTGKKLLNLDSEDFGVVTVGCAGGGNSDITLPIKKVDLKDDLEALKINISGLKGGHSGVDIHEQRGNAVKLLTRVIWKINKDFDIKIAELKGGDKHNAIPRESQAVICYKKSDKEKISKTIDEEKNDIKEEIKPIDPGFQLKTENIDKPAKVLNEDSQKRILNLLHALPHGVEKMSYDIPDMVETSTNLAKVTMDDNNANILLSSRSSIMSALQNLRDRINSIATLSGAKVEEEEPYPGWKPDMTSDLLKLSKKVFKDMYNKEPVVEAIHAGLECGIIGEKYPGMEMISIGPTVKAPHSPDERVHISTVDKTYKYVLELLKKI
jgi:dipeptidase D